MTDDRTYAQAARAWPFEEAKKLVERYKSAPPKKSSFPVLVKQAVPCVI